MLRAIGLVIAMATAIVLTPIIAIIATDVAFDHEGGHS